MFYMYLADGFEEIEALATVDFMRRAGIEVKTAGVTGEYVTGSHKIKVKTDCSADDVDISTADGVILPGGMPGTINLEACKSVTDSVKFCADNYRFVCAICAAPSVLGHLGLLKGKKATCFPGFEKELSGADIVDSPCVTDGKFITARGAGSVFAFSRAIITAVCGEETADRVLRQAQCI